MTAVHIVPLAASDSKRSAPLARIIDSVGTDDFSPLLANLFEEVSGSVYLAGFQVIGERSRLLAHAGQNRPDIAAQHARRYVEGMHWRHDPAVVAAAEVHCGGAPTVLIRVDPMAIDDPILQNEFYRPAGICDKLAICARRGNTFYGLNAMHTQESGGFTREAVRRLAMLAEVIISALAKHASLYSDPASLEKSPLASVQGIERRLTRTAWALTGRESQVCARILYGMLVPGIALDLGIRIGSVATYRKRAYTRLGISSRHELLREYLKENAAGMTVISTMAQPIAS